MISNNHSTCIYGLCTCSANLFKQRISFYFLLLLIIEYHDKHKAKVAGILKEKTQVEEKKQIITG